MTKASALESNLMENSCSSATTAAGLGEAALKILIDRGLDPETLARHGVRDSKVRGRGRVAIEIPVFRDGVEVNAKYRTICGEKEFSQTKGAPKIMFNHDCMREWAESKSPLLICEGELDALSAIQCGYLAVSVCNGAPSQTSTEGGNKYDYLETVPSGGTIIICSDSDAPGQNLLHDLALRLGRQRCKWVKYPKGCKDLNDALRIYGERGVRATIDNAQWMEIDGLYHMGELPPLEEPEYKQGLLPIKICKGDFWVITGIPGMGKTHFTNFVAYEVAKSGWHVTFASFEQKPQTRHKHNLRSLALERSAHGAMPDELAHVDRWIDDHFTFIVPNRKSERDLVWLMERMQAAVLRKSTDMFIIDPWNELEADLDKSTTQSDYIKHAIMELKHFAEDYRVVVMVVAHPTKQRGKDGAPPPVPTLYDIEDSRHWYGKADVGLVVHLQDTGDTLVRVAKAKDHEWHGSPGDYVFSYDRGSKHYSKNPYYSCA